jgi:hypothetical protein
MFVKFFIKRRTQAAGYEKDIYIKDISLINEITVWSLD